MNIMDGTPEPGDEPQILLICVADSYYILHGETYLKQLMLVDGVFPKPVRCIRFETLFELQEYFEGPANLAELWSINPQIIDRLRRDEHLLEIDASQG